MINEHNYKSNAAFLFWMKPILVALKELGGQGTPQDVRSIIAKMNINSNVVYHDVDSYQSLLNIMNAI